MKDDLLAHLLTDNAAAVEDSFCSVTRDRLFEINSN